MTKDLNNTYNEFCEKLTTELLSYKYDIVKDFTETYDEVIDLDNRFFNMLLSLRYFGTITDEEFDALNFKANKKVKQIKDKLEILVKSKNEITDYEIIAD